MTLKQVFSTILVGTIAKKHKSTKKHLNSEIVRMPITIFPYFIFTIFLHNLYNSLRSLTISGLAHWIRQTLPENHLII